MLFEGTKWKKELAIYVIIAFALTVVVAVIIPYPYSLPVLLALLFLSIWQYHKMITKNNTELKADRLFGSGDWWKELVVIVIIHNVIGMGFGIIFPRPYVYAVAVPVLFLVIWLLHRRAIQKREKIL